MDNPIFRKKSIERASSPEQLSDYIRVTNPGIWIILAAVFLLLAGFFVWAVVGKVESKVTAVAVAQDGTTVCYVKEAEFSGISEGNTVRVGSKEYTVSTVSGEPVAVDDSFTAYTLHVGGLQLGEWVYAVTLDAELPAGVYQASIVTDSISPISLLFH